MEIKNHIIFLVHGLHGTQNDLQFLKTTLNSKYNNIISYCSSVNEGWKTYEGIDISGKRLYEEIKEVSKKYKELKYFSIIGHSLGGLIARYSLGLLYEDQFFQYLIPLNYISIASPHVGLRRSPKAWTNYVANWFTSNFLSSTGSQLMLEDENLSNTESIPILVSMTLPESSFFKGLELFKKRVAYANIYNDFQVPYSTAAISPYNPYRQERNLVFSVKYPHVIEVNNPTIDQNKDCLSNIDEYYINDQKKEYLCTILKHLHNLEWERFGICFKYNPLAHEMIVAKRSWMQSNSDVITHIVDHFIS